LNKSSIWKETFIFFSKATDQSGHAIVAALEKLRARIFQGGNNWRGRIMINRGGEMEVFVRVVELGSFSNAARKMRITPSAVSKMITRMEDRLGVPLITRSTRGLTLTMEGQEYYERAQRVVADIEQAEEAVTSGSREPRGLLRVNSNVPFATRILIPSIPIFLAKYSGITLDLTLSDITVDLIGERADVAIRTGNLLDSALRARKLLDSPRMVVASPDYLAAHGAPDTPDDLEHHNCLSFNLRRSLDEWPFLEAPGSGQVVKHFVEGSMRVDNGETMRQLALGGLGIARLSKFHVGHDVAEGRLKLLLQDYNPGDLEPIHAIYVGHDHVSNRVRAFIDFLVENIRH
jgi:DNA-binding transcriptional LysR family regulator